MFYNIFSRGKLWVTSRVKNIITVMNTWTIEPNVLVWLLLIVSTLSLLSIAICFAKLVKRRGQNKSAKFPIQNDKDNDNDSHKTSYTSLVATNIVLILFLISVACALCFGGIKLNTTGSATILISAFGVLVTFLVAWQIGMSLISREEVRKIERVSNRLNTIEKQMIMLRNTPDGHLFYVLAISKFEKQEYYDAFEYFAIATLTFIENNIPYEKFSTVALSYMGDCLDNAKKTGKDLDIFKNRAQGVHQRLDSILTQVDKIERFADEARSKVNSIRTKAQQYDIV